MPHMRSLELDQLTGLCVILVRSATLGQNPASTVGVLWSEQCVEQ